jgi:hypothetical protein
MCLRLQLCSMSLVTGLLICLHSAAKITHKTQAVTSVAAEWHVDATINSTDRDEENPKIPSKAHLLHQQPTGPFPPAEESMSSGEESDEDGSRSEDRVDTSRFTSFHVNISFQKRQALGEHSRVLRSTLCMSNAFINPGIHVAFSVTYLENNQVGITVFGFVVDRTCLHALFMIEFSLVMWLLGKTIGIS